MQKTVGIPRALLYYNYYPLWKTFFEELGCSVILSEKTSKEIMNRGIEVTVDDVCLPIKIYHGHIRNLLMKDLDYIFIPRIVSIYKKEYICPKFSGLPDMIRCNINELPTIISPIIDWSKSRRELTKVIFTVGSIFTSNPYKIWSAYKKGINQLKIYKLLLKQGFMPEDAINILVNKKDLLTPDFNKGKYTVLLLGHSYNIYDNFINMNIVQKLRKMECNVITPEQLPTEKIEKEVEKLPKKIFWSMSKKLVGNYLHYIKTSEIQGIIYLVSFGCGPDSLIGELVWKWANKNGQLPFMFVTLDEHTGETGFNTRLEAFVDMIERRVNI
ncbi:MAG TPA: hypothetical protein GXZ31_02090 [Thermoanaerobacterales bacterium]|nr:hypothetical protein [Thermoanaerobacterales bacterium]